MCGWRRGVRLCLARSVTMHIAGRVREHRCPPRSHQAAAFGKRAEALATDMVPFLKGALLYEVAEGIKWVLTGMGGVLGSRCGAC